MDEISKTTDITTFQNDTKQVMLFIQKLVGDKTQIKPIEDDKTMFSVTENLDTIKKLIKAIEEHFKPLKAEKKAVWQSEVDKESELLDPVKRIKSFVETRLSEYTDKIRAKKMEQARIESEELAKREREALLAQSQSAENAGNTEVAEAYKELAVGHLAEPIQEIKIKAQANTGTLSESDEIKDFQIINQLDCIKDCIVMGIGGFLSLDSKTETAIKKYLKDNPSIKTIQGTIFKRGFKLNYRTKS